MYTHTNVCVCPARQYVCAQLKDFSIAFSRYVCRRDCVAGDNVRGPQYYDNNDIALVERGLKRTRPPRGDASSDESPETRGVCYTNLDINRPALRSVMTYEFDCHGRDSDAY